MVEAFAVQHLVIITCCRYNKSGSCRNCSCVKANSKCTNCLPSRLFYVLTTLILALKIIQQLQLQVLHLCMIRKMSLKAWTVLTVQITREWTAMRFPIRINVSYLINLLYQYLSPLPDPSPISDPFFLLGNVDSAVRIDHMNDAYDEIVHWRMNLFSVPFGSQGKCFITELARLYRFVTIGSSL